MSSPEQAAAFVAARRKLHIDARHTVWAYLLRDGAARCSDDGEPQGTGGQPALEVLRREGLTDVCVAITRYFGGILLGAGGLTRAYSGGASLAAAAAERITYHACVLLELEMEYAQYQSVLRLLPLYGARVEDAAFGAAVTLRVLLREETVDSLLAALREATAATVRPIELGKRFAAL
ncbi:MAG: YigZ family protein [Oscillospiraceae bacterium]